jgi:hypothetical protein
MVHSWDLSRLMGKKGYKASNCKAARLHASRRAAQTHKARKTTAPQKGLSNKKHKASKQTKRGRPQARVFSAQFRVMRAMHRRHWRLCFPNYLTSIYPTHLQRGRHGNGAQLGLVSSYGQEGHHDGKSRAFLPRCSPGFIAGFTVSSDVGIPRIPYNPSRTHATPTPSPCSSGS